METNEQLNAANSAVGEYYNNISPSNYGWWDNITGAANTTISNNAFTAGQAAIDREYNASEAQKNRDWQEYMSNTSYQRMMKDAKAAGINPLNLNGTSGASTPSGSTATAGGTKHSAATGNNFGSVLGSVIAMVGGVLMKGISTGAQLANTTAKNETLKDIAKMKATNSAEEIAERTRHNITQENIAKMKEAKEWANTFYDAKNDDNKHIEQTIRNFRKWLDTLN